MSEATLAEAKLLSLLTSTILLIYNFLFFFCWQKSGNASFAKPLRSLKSTIMKSCSGSVHIFFSSSSNLHMDRFIPAPMVITRTPRDLITSACSKATRRSCALPSVNMIRTSFTPGLSPFSGSPLKTWENLGRYVQRSLYTEVLMAWSVCCLMIIGVCRLEFSGCMHLHLWFTFIIYDLHLHLRF